VPTVRSISTDAPRRVARAFNRLAWPAFGALVLTGIWNLLAIDVSSTSTAYQVTLGIKLLVVAASGIGAALHSMARTKAGLAVWGAVSGIAALAAVFFGVLLMSAG
jgi:hypothetical protein